MPNPDLLSDTNIYKNTYAELVHWVKDLSWWVRHYRGLDELNKAQAKRIMELEFDLRRYSSIMVEDQQETLMKEYGVPESNVVTFPSETLRPKRGGTGGGSGHKDWLSEMEWGTVFYARMNNTSQPWLLVKFMLAGIRQKTALLVPMLGAEDVVTDDRNWMAVDPVAFTKVWKLHDEFPPVPIESNNGQHNLDAE